MSVYPSVCQKKKMSEFKANVFYYTSTGRTWIVLVLYVCTVDLFLHLKVFFYRRNKL